MNQVQENRREKNRRMIIRVGFVIVYYFFYQLKHVHETQEHLLTILYINLSISLHFPSPTETIDPQLSAITQDDLPIPEDDDEEEEAIVEKESKETEAHDIVAVVPASNGDSAPPTEDGSRSSVPLIEPISPTNSMSESIEKMPSENDSDPVQNDTDPVLQPKGSKKKKSLWGLSSKKSSK